MLLRYCSTVCALGIGRRFVKKEEKAPNFVRNIQVFHNNTNHNTAGVSSPFLLAVSWSPELVSSVKFIRSDRHAIAAAMGMNPRGGPPAGGAGGMASSPPPPATTLHGASVSQD